MYPIFAQTSLQEILPKELNEIGVLTKVVEKILKGEIRNMLRYNVEASITISVELNNEYKVWLMANWNKDDQKYNVIMYLQRNDIDLLDKMDELTRDIESDRQSIKSDLCKMVSYLAEKNNFDQYIKRYEYQMQCFDKGNELLESESNNV